MKPTYTFDPYSGITTCTLRDKSNNVVTGMARLHPLESFESQRVGEYIATTRAEIKYYKLIRRQEILPKMNALKHLYACIANTNSKKYNKDSEEAQLVWRQYWIAHAEYQALGDMIESLEMALREYIKSRNKGNSD